MNMSICKIVTIIAIGSTISLCAAEEPTSIFNGRDLTGWEGDPELWSVQDEAITGIATDQNPLPHNKFLIWGDGTLKNFELRAKVRLVGNSNSGIQYRSQLVEDVGEFVVGGYQCDIHPRADYNGMLYDERGRGIIAIHGTKVVIDEEGNKSTVGSTGPVTEIELSQWNDFEIIANGNHLIHKINGQTAVDVVDNQVSARRMEGILAFQVHRGPAMKIQFKDIFLTRLPDDSNGDATSLQ